MFLNNERRIKTMVTPLHEDLQKLWNDVLKWKIGIVSVACGRDTNALIGSFLKLRSKEVNSNGKFIDGDGNYSYEDIELFLEKESIVISIPGSKDNGIIATVPNEVHVLNVYEVKDNTNVYIGYIEHVAIEYIEGDIVCYKINVKSEDGDNRRFVIDSRLDHVRFKSNSLLDKPFSSVYKCKTEDTRLDVEYNNLVEYVNTCTDHGLEMVDASGLFTLKTLLFGDKYILVIDGVRSFGCNKNYALKFTSIDLEIGQETVYVSYISLDQDEDGNYIERVMTFRAKPVYKGRGCNLECTIEK